MRKTTAEVVVAVVPNTGYGLEGVLPDITCSRILRGLVNPKMAQGKRVVIF